MSATSLYDKDFYAWTQEQARLIKAKSLQEVDLVHLLEEVEDMGKHEKRELSSRLEVLLTHLLKWKYQPTHRGASWELTIKEQRKKIYYHLLDNPSLKNEENLKTIFERAYDYAIYEAAKETKLKLECFPEFCEWSSEQVLNKDFFPE